jgi:hypothetical protein
MKIEIYDEHPLLYARKIDTKEIVKVFRKIAGLRELEGGKDDNN